MLGAQGRGKWLKLGRRENRGAGGNKIDWGSAEGVEK